MPDPGARPPVAIRIVRPYDTEEAFLENELETVGKTSVILIGAHSRPAGVILRFEVTLSSGVTVLRGEGRVLGHKEAAFRGQPGLALRFTRLDPRSKALVDRAAAIRDARLSGDAARASAPPPFSSGTEPVISSMPAALSAPPDPSLAPDPVLAQIFTSPTPPFPPVGPAVQTDVATLETGVAELNSGVAARNAGVVALNGDVVALNGDVVALNGDVAPLQSPMASHQDAIAPLQSPVATLQDAIAPFDDVERVGTRVQEVEHVDSANMLTDRDALLARLRQRARNLTDEKVATILRPSLRPSR